MSNDEQKEEIEVLQSIYPDELTILTETSFRIKLALDPPPTFSSSSTEDDPPVLLLHVSYPPEYPSVAPDIDITLDPSTPSTSSLSFPEDKDTLLKSLQDVIEENLGIAMVFTLAGGLKDGAEALITDRAAQKERKREAAIRAEEEKEMEKFRGELVTRERFVEWQARFFKEREEEARVEKERLEEEGKKGGKVSVQPKEKKLTGRELFERGLVGATDVDEDEEGGNVVEEQLVDGVKEIKV